MDVLWENAGRINERQVGDNCLKTYQSIISIWEWHRHSRLAVNENNSKLKSLNGRYTERGAAWLRATYGFASLLRRTLLYTDTQPATVTKFINLWAMDRCFASLLRRTLLYTDTQSATVTKFINLWAMDRCLFVRAVEQSEKIKRHKLLFSNIVKSE